MVKDFYESFKDNIKERTSNPFLGTFAVVWIIKNWVLVYSLLYFDPKLNLEGRLAYISNYFSGQSFILNLFYSVCITLLILLTTYIFLDISRYLSNVNDGIIIPWIYKITDKSSVVRKSEYVALQEKVRELEQRVETERQAKLKAFLERDELELKALPNATIQENREVLATNAKLFAKIIASYDRELIGQIVVNIRKGDYLGTTPLINDLLKYNFVEVINSFDNTKKYKLTNAGEEFVVWFNDHTATES